MKAFPEVHYEKPGEGMGVSIMIIYGGMDLRDYFAAKAMQALVKTVQDCITSPEEVSKLSYKYADAMMKVREK